MLTEWHEIKAGRHLQWARSPADHPEHIVLLVERRGHPPGTILVDGSTSTGYTWRLNFYPPGQDTEDPYSGLVRQDIATGASAYWPSLDAAQARGDRAWAEWWEWYSSTKLYSDNLRQLSADELAALDEVGPLEVARRLEEAGPHAGDAALCQLDAAYLRIQLAERCPPVIYPEESASARLVLLNALELYEFELSQRSCKEVSP